MIRLENVSVRRGGRPVLGPISLSIAAGEMTVLLGPNGAGKSTLLSVLAGELAPHTGEAQFGRLSYAQWPRHALAKRRAIMPQHAGLTFPIPVKAIVAMGRAPFHHMESARANAEAVNRALTRAGAQALRDRPYTELSGGERQRVQLARVLAQIDGAAAPSFAFLDEPTSSLDPAHQQSLLRLARELSRQGVGVVVSLHDLGLAARYADRVVVLAGGVVAADGPPEQALSADVVASVFTLRAIHVRDPETGLRALITDALEPEMRKEAAE